MHNRPFAESCEQNKEPILNVLKQIFIRDGDLLEIGSGTGQHALFFSEQLPHLTWQPTDMEDQIAGMKLWLCDASHDRMKEPKILDVSQKDWLIDPVDYAFTANTIHIVSWAKVISMFEGMGKVLKPDGLFANYGPFNYGGQFTSESNARFDQWLKARDPESGVRNFEDLETLAKENGMELFKDFEMPANNRTLVWKKI